MRDIFYLMRVHQYIKNFFIFLPAFFSFKLFDLSGLMSSFVAFIGFCLCCSAVYIFNDIFDVKEDKLHPSKSHRPIASGKISIKVASIIALCLLLVGGGGLIFFIPELFFCLLFYILINLFYTLKLKHIAILDIFIIASGFVVRLFIGALSIHQGLSEWIIVMTFLLALFLAIAKRRDDVILYESSGKKMRKVIDGYNKTFLDIAMGVSASIVMIAYILWSISPEVKDRLHSDYLYLSSVFVLAGIFRYMQITFVDGKSASPSKIVLKDRFLQGCILLWLCFLIVLMYL